MSAADPRRFYDGIAQDFDGVMNRYDLERRLEVVYDELLAGVDLRDVRLLDAGCGTGPFSEAARRRGARVVSLDIGVNLLKVVAGRGLRDLVAGDVTSLPFEDGSFDVVVTSECIEHTPSPQRAVSELARVLLPGGRLALTCPNRFWHWSCVVADALGLRPYCGLENWPGWSSLAGWLDGAGVRVERHRGLHLFPFQISATHPLLRRLDRAGDMAGRVYVNQCVLGVKL